MSAAAIPMPSTAVPDKTRRWLIAISDALGALLEIDTNDTVSAHQG